MDAEEPHDRLFVSEIPTGLKTDRADMFATETLAPFALHALFGFARPTHVYTSASVSLHSGGSQNKNNISSTTIRLNQYFNLNLQIKCSQFDLNLECFNIKIKGSLHDNGCR